MVKFEKYFREISRWVTNYIRKRLIELEDSTRTYLLEIKEVPDDSTTAQAAILKVAA